MDDFGLGRQFGGDLLFGAAQEEGLDPRIQVLQAFFVALLLDGGAVVAVELLAVAQPAWHQEVEQRPEFA